MTRIPPETLDQIVARVDSAEVVGRYVQLKRQGREFVGLCPFHSERTPSFSVNPEKGLWHCYGCGEGGSIFRFIEKIEGLSFLEAAKKLGGEAGVEILFSEQIDAASEHRELLSQLMERSALYYSELLWRSPLAYDAREYLKGRGISTEIARKFRLGWAPVSGEALVKKLGQAGYELAHGVEAGLLRERRGRILDMLRGRLIFPITNASGKVIAFGGRLIESNQDVKAPKYLNTPETELFQKREQLYGLSLHRGEISRANEAIVVEGYLDVIALSQAGFSLAVAALGTALTEHQCRLLARYARRVHLFYDADRAGRNATEKAIGLFEDAGLLIHIGRMAQGEDPDSFIRDHGAEAFKELKHRTVSVVDYLIALKSEEYDLSTVAGKQDFLAALIPVVAKVRDEAQRDRYSVRIAGLTYSAEHVILSRIQALRRRAAITKKGDQALHANQVPPPSTPRSQSAAIGQGRRTALPAEERLISLLLQEPRWIPFVAERLLPEDLSSLKLRPLLEVLLRKRSIESPLTWSELGDADHDREVTWARLSAAVLPESSCEDMERLVQDVKHMGLEPRYEAMRRRVLEGLASGEISPESPVFQEYMSLQQRLKGTKNE